MRLRYRFHACPTPACPKLRAQPGRCPEHDVEMVPVILRREDAAQTAKATADKMKAAAEKVDQAAGKPQSPFGDILGDLFKKP